jgi:tetratricopeptide (TPR) repeat protein
VDFLYRPRRTLSCLRNHTFAGNAGAGYHAVNFLLHALAVLLLFELVLRISGAGASACQPFAFCAAALWAIHPIGTEAVTNVAGRGDLLAAVFVLAGMVLWARDPSRRTAPALFLLTLLGGLSKESALVLPALMLLWDVAFRRRLRVAPYLAAAAGVAAVFAARAAVFAASPWPGQEFLDNPLRGAGFWTARLTALKIVGIDLGLLVWPANLAFDHSYNQIVPLGWRDPWVWVSLFVVAEALLLVTLRRKRDPVLFFAAGWYGITLLPTSNLAVLIGSIMAVRFSYLPSVGFAIAAAALLFRLKNRRLVYALAAAAVVLFAARTLARNPAWDSNLSLGIADAAAAPESFRVHRLLSNALVAANPELNLEAAIREGERAWDMLEPLPESWSSPQAASDLGYLYQLKADRAGGAATPQGRGWYEKSLAVLQQGEVLAHVFRRVFDETQRAHGKPPRPQGGYELLYLNLGKAYLALGRAESSASAYREARAQNPRERKAYIGLAAAELARAGPEAAVVPIVEMAILFDLDPETLDRLRTLYARIPGGDCALSGSKLDAHCPRVARDLCAAFSDLKIGQPDLRDFSGCR